MTELVGDVAIYKLYTPQILDPYLEACNSHEQARLLAYCEALYLYDEQDEWALTLQSNMEDCLTEHFMQLLLPYQDRDINQMIRHGICRGRHYGIKTRHDFAFYLGMMFDLGPNFDEHPRIQKWLYQWDKKCEMCIISLNPSLLIKTAHDEPNKIGSRSQKPIKF